MLIFTLCVNFVSTTGFFDSSVEVGPDINETSGNQTMLNIAGYTVDTVWAALFSVALIGGIALAWITHSTAVIGVYFFSVIFWASYVNMWGVVNLGNYVPPEFSTIAHASILFLWVGAIIGMFSGSG